MQPKLYKLVKNIDLSASNTQIIDADTIQTATIESKNNKPQSEIIIAREVIED